MKRIAAFFVALFLIATCTVFVSAADVTATMSSAEAEHGDTVVLTVTLAGAPATAKMGFELDIPEGITLLENADTCWKTVAGMANVIVANKQGVWINMQAADNNGVVLSLAFKVEDTAACGENTIGLEFFVDDTATKAENVTEVDGVITLPPHSWDDELTTDDAEGHYYACEVCGAEKDFEEHKYSMSCDETCDVCGYTRTDAEHDFSETLVNTDPYGHYYACEACGEEKGFEDHKYSMSCDETCDECGYTRTEVEHDFSETLVKDDPEGHWYECECGAKDGVAEHNYSYDCDATCNDCGYVREAADHQPVGDVKYDETGHWGQCACGEPIDKNDHKYEFECSTDCEYCDYVREAEHDFSETLVNDDPEGHWYDCMYGCGAIDGKEAHVYDQKIVEDDYLYSYADCTNPAVYFYVCDCGFCSYDEELTYEEGEPDPDAHEYYYDYESDSSTCWICDDVIENAKGEAVEKVEGNGATITAPEGVLGENFELNVEDFTEEMQEMIPDFGEVLGEDYNGFGLVDFKYYYLTVGDAYAEIAEGMTITVKIPGGKKFKDVEPFFPSDDDDDIENIITYTDNGDGTITITLNEAMMNQIADLGAIPVLFIGKPVASGTSDNGLTALWIAVLAMAVLGVVATAYYSKKKATK